jgi:ubiquinone/menaquinone biosynthesis C-methylase UbiE
VIDLEGLRREQREAWGAGDFARFATTILVVSESLCEAADLHAGHQVLDVACGSGNTALCAARRWCEVTGLDYVPSLLDRARERARFEGLDIRFDEGDAVALPYADRSFDVVLSTFGVMFVPDQERAAAEMVRVCRPGGTIGMANFDPSSLVAGFFRTAAKFIAPPRGVRPPVLWGTEEGVRAIFGDSIAEVRVVPRKVVFRYRSPEHWFEFFSTNFGPIRTVYESLDEQRRGAFAQELTGLVAAANRSGDDTLVADVEYAEVLLTTRDSGR